MNGILPVRKTPPNAILEYLPRWQSNNSPTNLGIKNFIFDLYEINRQLGYPTLIRDFNPKFGIAPWAADALSKWFYYEKGMTKEDRCHVIATHREGSKTFWFSFVLPVYLNLIGQYGVYYQDYLLPETDYVVLRAKNNKEGQKRILNIANFTNKPLITDLFGQLKPSFKEVKEKEGKDTGSLVVYNNGYILESSGIEQPSRGLNLFQVRPKLFVFDDVQNKENTKTPERRRQIDSEVMEESFGAVSDEGSMIYIGNKVHAADTLGRLLNPKNPMWRKHFYTLTMRPLANNKLAAGVGDLDNEIPLWGKRWSIERVRKLFAFYESQPELGGIRSVLKEYYNIIKSDANYKLLYHEGTYLREHGINWLVFRDEKGQKVYKNVYIIIGLDPAISESKKACDASIAVIAVDSEKKRYILELKYGKFDIQDRFIDDFLKPQRGFALTIDELANVRRIGSSHEIARMAYKYHADAVDIEARVGQQMTFFNVAEDALKSLGWRGVLRPEPAPPEGKEEKLRQTPLIYFEAGLYHLPSVRNKSNVLIARQDVIELENDIIAFPDCKKDRLDSIYLAEQVISYPKKIEYNPLGIYRDAEESRKSEEDKNIYKSGQLLNNHESWIVL